jgi:hypothetical protein
MKKTTQAQAVRGASMPATSPVTLTHRLAVKAATERAEVISLKLYGLTEIVKLAAFAVEARRTLGGIQHVMPDHPKAQAAINDNVPYSTNWAEMDNNTGEVLWYVSMQLEEVNGDATKNVYALARVASPSEATTAQEGGAA